MPGLKKRMLRCAPSMVRITLSVFLPNGLQLLELERGGAHKKVKP